MVSVSAAQKAKFDQILSEEVESRSTPALFFGVTDVDGEIYMRQAGTKVVGDPSSGLIDEDSVFWLCSQTKLITTIAALKLIEQGKITLDTPVEQILPELANPVIITGRNDAGEFTTTPAKEKIRFGQLLNHTSGLDYNVDGTTPASGMPISYSHSYKGEGTSEFFKIIKGSFSGVPLKFEPGTDWAYGFSSDCAGFIIERLSGKSLEEYFKEHIFAPLGLKSTSFYLTSALKERLIPLSSRDVDGKIATLKEHSYIDQDPENVGVHLGGVGLHGSQKDYLTILRHLLQIKSGRATNPILSLASFNTMFEPTVPPSGEASMDGIAAILNKHLGLPAGGAQFSRGLFVNIVDIPGKRKKGSGAWGGWANTAFFVDPTTSVAAVVGTQLVPTGDEKFQKICALLETELYSGLQ